MLLKVYILNRNLYEWTHFSNQVSGKSVDLDSKGNMQ